MEALRLPKRVAWMPSGASASATAFEIAVTVLGVNFLGDGLRDLLDPRLRKQT